MKGGGKKGGGKMTLSLSLCPHQSSSGVDQPQMMVGKALLNSPKTKEVSEGQLALESFLARRRRKYHAKIARGSANTSCEEPLPSSSFKHESMGASLLSREAKESLFLYKRNCVARLASISVPSMKDGLAARSIDHDSPHTGGAKLADFSQLDCEELAQHVVSRAKVRLKRRKKRAANVLQNIYKPVLNSSPSRPLPPHPPPIRASTPINSKTSTPKFLSPSKPITEAREKLTKPLEQENAESDQRPGLKAVRKVVYWSERQSTIAGDSGIPCVPPSTPKSITFCEDVKFVPSMSDIKSQQKLKSRLKAINVKNQEDANKEQVMKVEREKREQKEAIARLKAQQRAEIYALNKVMAEFEKLKFESVMSGKV